VILSSKEGGLATPHTPKSVAYYLDQAQRAHSVAANSAAVAMYRAALEHLLFEQGFTNGMLGQKLVALTKAIATGTAPSWTKDLDPAYMTVIKDLGNGAIHTNSGDISKQDALDAGVLTKVQITFGELLDTIYELPLRRKARLASMTAAAEVVK
jgi:hypothetical protein